MTQQSLVIVPLSRFSLSVQADKENRANLASKFAINRLKLFKAAY